MARIPSRGPDPQAARPHVEATPGALYDRPSRPAWMDPPAKAAAPKPAPKAAAPKEGDE